MPTNQDAQGKTAEQAWAELHPGMVNNPQTLALLRRLHAALPVTLEVVSAPKNITSKDDKQREAATKELRATLPAKPKADSAVALRICVYKPEPVKDAKVPALQYLFAVGEALHLPDLRTPSLEERRHVHDRPSGTLRLAEQDYSDRHGFWGDLKL